MAYIWSYLRRYPKWLAMNFTAAILDVYKRQRYSITRDFNDSDKEV